MIESLASLVGVISYLKIVQGFFQQDEWLSFAYNYTLRGQNILANAFNPNVGHYQPFNTIVIYILTRIFGINYTPYAILSIILHGICVYLVFWVAKLVFKNTKLAIISSLLFAVNASSYQATSWILADTGIHLSVIFALLSLGFFVTFLKSAKNKSFVLSLTFLVISLLFKETAIGMFAFYPIIFFIFRRKWIIKKRKHFISILVLGLIYVLMRVLMLKFGASSTGDSFVGDSQTHFQVIYNVLSYPIKAFSQSLFSSAVIISLLNNVAALLPKMLTGGIGTTKFDLFVQKRLLEGASYLIFFIFIGIGISFLRRLKEKFQKGLLLSIFAFIILNGFIYGLSPEKQGIVTDLDSRNLYFISIGSSFLLAFIYDKISKRKVANIGLALFMILNLYLLELRLNSVVEASRLRRMIVTQIMRDHSILPKKVVIYTQSDSSFYGLPVDEKIMPFQSGFGQTLLVLYYERQGYPKSFFDNRFLWGITDEGYESVDGVGFGYFRDMTKLKEIVKTEKLGSESIIGYKYFSKTEKLVDDTENLKKEVFGK